MDECGFTMGLAEADKEAAGKNYARAIELYTALGQKYPAKEAIVQARTQGVNQQQQFEGLVSDADEALRQREYAKARRKYKEAGELMPSRAVEVKVKVQKALYFEAIDLGQECLDHNDFDAAIAHFKRALSKAVGKEESDRVQLLILEAERRKKGRLKATE
jgi:outer membrane protein assembly factor BamD (BamD/ComL family)